MRCACRFGWLWWPWRSACLWRWLWLMRLPGAGFGGTGCSMRWCICHWVLPPVVTGYLLLVVFGRKGTFGPVLEALGMQLAFTSAGAALAAAVMAFPLIVRAIRLALEAVDPRLEEAAGTLGASPIKVFAFVTLPLILPGLVAGAVVGFAKALGEFGATITFVSNIPGETQTLASAIYAVLQVPGQEAAVGRMIALSLILSFGALLLSEILARKMVRR